MRFSTILFSLVLCFLSVTSVVQNKSKIWEDFASKKGVGATLPDFSFAGVNYLETGIPKADFFPKEDTLTILKIKQTKRYEKNVFYYCRLFA